MRAVPHGRPLVAAIETGGTKFRVAVASGPNEIVSSETIATTDPATTLERVVAATAGHPVEAAGIGAFGPIDLDPASPSFGHLLATPKPGWSGVDVAGEIRRGMGVPTVVETDVGAAAIGEMHWGAAFGCDDFVYITVGTGIGMGVVIGGSVHHGMGHPEAGHLPVARMPGDEFPGTCPFHGACLEGMASGPAIERRWGASGDQLVDRAEVWELEAGYLAQAVQALTYVVAPQRIVIGGGVAQQPGLVGQVEKGTAAALGGYAASPTLQRGVEGYVVPAALGQDAGLLGALALGLGAAR